MTTSPADLPGQMDYLLVLRALPDDVSAPAPGGGAAAGRSRPGEE